MHIVLYHFLASPVSGVNSRPAVGSDSVSKCRLVVFAGQKGAPFEMFHER
jgi:hypothetical protein